MKKPVTVKLLAKSGMGVTGFAKRLGNRCSTSEAPSGYQIHDGYILKAQRNIKGYTVLVMDTPLFLMLSGDTRTNTVTPNPSVAVGARDAFLPSTEPAVVPPTTTYTGVGKESNFYVPPAQPKDPVSGVSDLRLWAPVQWRGPVFCLGTKRLPFLATSGFNAKYDNPDAFPFSQTVTLTGKMASFMACALPTGTVNQLRNTYLGLAHFNVSEDDLPGDWTHHPRRMVAGPIYTSVADPWRLTRDAAAMWQFGVAWSPAGEMEPGADHFCLVSEIYNQVRTTWTRHDGESYNPPYYDREGMHALGVFFGRLARDQYNPDDAQPIYAELVDQFMVTAQDLPVPDLRPYPPMLGGDWDGGPLRPNFGYFVDPLVLRTTEGFTAFCKYEQQRTNQPGFKVRAMLVVTPDRTTHTLKADATGMAADWPSGDTHYLTLPDYDPMQPVRCNPWLVGGFTVDGVNPGGGTTHTAFALVYEHDDSVAAEQLTEFPLPWVNIGQSKWALYTVESGAPTRTVLTEATPSASPVATLLTKNLGYPMIQVNGSISFWGAMGFDLAKQQRLCNFANAGNGLAVTASIDKPFPMTLTGGTTEDGSALPAHDVKCAVVNLLDGTIEQRGTIFVRDRIYTWCFITVAQPYDPGDPDQGIPETPPTLVASTHETTNIPGPSGKTWLSRDGGWTWSEYVTDVGAQMGAHLVGNRLFEYDPLKPFL